MMRNGETLCHEVRRSGALETSHRAASNQKPFLKFHGEAGADHEGVSVGRRGTGVDDVLNVRLNEAPRGDHALVGRL